MVDHGQWNRGKSCSEGMNYIIYISGQVIKRQKYYIRMIRLIILSMYNIAFHRQQKWGLSTYLYAPKDDYKHRMFWRELYSVEEAGDYSQSILR